MAKAYQARGNRASGMWRWACRVAALGLAVSAHAWGPEGHAVVGEIAEKLLTPAAREAVSHVLGGDRLGDDAVASWPDYIRGVHAWEQAYPNNDKWHYINIELAEDALPSDGTNVVTAIRHFTEVLKSSTNLQARREALCFLVHFVGDIHQPLHCTHRNNDRGGNLQRVQAFKGAVYSITYGKTPEDELNLHGVWDFCLVKEALGEQSVHAFAEALGGALTPAERSRWAGGEAGEWALESHRLGRTKAYAWTNGRPLPVAGAITLTPANYITDRTAVVRRQLQKAGVRLADLLNATLGD